VSRKVVTATTRLGALSYILVQEERGFHNGPGREGERETGGGFWIDRLPIRLHVRKRGKKRKG